MIGRKLKTLFLISVFLTATFLVLYRSRFFPQESTVQDLTSLDYKYENLDALATEVQIDYFKKYLGDPVFINYSEDRTQQEYVFVDDDFFVQAITNSDGKVLAYAVTTRNSGFNPVLKLPDIEIILGVSKLENLGQMPNRICHGFIGNFRSFYYEENYFGRPGRYQTYLLGVSSAGYPGPLGTNLGLLDGKLEHLKDISNEDWRSLRWNQVDCSSVPEEFRAGQIINTYLILAGPMWAGSEKIKFGFGVNSDQVQLLGKRWPTKLCLRGFGRPLAKKR